ncbi:Uncharacterised protein [Mycobacterium tuberculosis]|uniref:Uncharacterized protein n=1 Tax=Mycobacterium tuberculosis TaxID=1773 RepID=A0A0U0S454_MYCTX|nr:Uncharacterised protein [Mycobacterium tuberculosis]
MIRASTPTGLLRLMTNMASTARCLGVPDGTGVPSIVICNGPSRPKSSRFSTVALPAIAGPPWLAVPRCQ